eukprot:augustus_masked-scaffold_24-processed-gene-3.51-mRNA-1 protein AED:1.00 eAED:1.00 QI:0/-1/0/0/-1/1/1/0/499
MVGKQKEKVQTFIAARETLLEKERTANSENLSLKQDVRHLKKDIEKLRNQKSHLREEVQKKDEEKRKLEDDFNQQLHELQTKIEDAENALQRAEEENEMKLKEVKMEKYSSEEKRRYLSKNLKTQKTDNEKLRIEIQNIKTKFEQGISRNERLKRENLTQGANLKKVKDKLGENVKITEKMEEELRDWKSKATENEEKYLNAIEKFTREEAKLKEICEKLVVLKRENNRKSEEINKQEQALALVKEESRLNGEKMKIVEKELKENQSIQKMLKNQCERAKTYRTQLEEKVKVLEKDLRLARSSFKDSNLETAGNEKLSYLESFLTKQGIDVDFLLKSFKSSQISQPNENLKANSNAARIEVSEEKTAKIIPIEEQRKSNVESSETELKLPDIKKITKLALPQEKQAEVNKSERESLSQQENSRAGLNRSKLKIPSTIKKRDELRAKRLRQLNYTPKKTSVVPLSKKPARASKLIQGVHPEALITEEMRNGDIGFMYRND